jgi:hypothetical protein
MWFIKLRIYFLFREQATFGIVYWASGNFIICTFYFTVKKQKNLVEQKG